MDTSEALFALANEVQKLEGRPYSDLVALIEEPIHTTWTSSSGIEYRIEISAAWGDYSMILLRLFFFVDTGGISSLFPLRMSVPVKRGSVFDGKLPKA